MIARRLFGATLGFVCIATISASSGCSSDCTGFGTSGVAFTIENEAYGNDCPDFPGFTAFNEQSVACGDECSCAIGAFIGSTKSYDAGVFGEIDTSHCDGQFNRVCNGPGSLTCDLTLNETNDGRPDLIGQCTIPALDGVGVCVYNLTGIPQ